MATKKFNQGDWAIHRHPDKYSVQIIGISTGGEHEDNFASCKVTLYNQESDANANLIAQAPAMYRMLQEQSELMKMLDPQTHPNIEIDAVKYDIDELLAKARGEFHTPAEVLSTLNTGANE